MHDPRVGRFFAVDPLAPEYPWNSVYAFSENRVIDGVELEGLEVQTLNPSIVQVGNHITGGLLRKINNFSVTSFFELPSYTPMSDGKLGGFDFGDDSGIQKGLNSLKRLGEQVVEKIDVTGIMQLASYAKSIADPSPSFDKGTLNKAKDEVERASHLASSFLDRFKGLQKTVSQIEGPSTMVVKSAVALDKVVNEEDKDTTVAAPFAAGIEKTEGTAIFHSTKDSVVTIPKKEVFNFNQKALQSVKNQLEQVNKILDER